MRTSVRRFVMIAPAPAVAVLVVVGLPHAWQPIHLVGLTLLLAGLALVTLARWQLGDSFSITPQATKLVTHGLYARIRNPIYVFGLVMFAGLVMYLDRPWFLLILILAAVMQVIRARREGHVLEEKFGDEYRAYRARTWF
jgi:protein-S-isoprenylcysteine O-methyltransferase Ste14